MKKGLNCLLIVVTCGLLAFGCQAEKKDTAQVSSESIPVETMESVKHPDSFPLNEKEEDSMVASVNGSVITGLEVKQEMDNLMRQFEGRISPEQMGIMRTKLREKALENLVNKRLFLQEADRQDIRPAAKAIDDEIAGIASRYPTMEKFREQIADMGISEEKLRQEIEKNLKIKNLLDMQVPPADEVNEEEIDAFYRNNPDNFQMPERIKASHILIRVNPDQDSEKREEKRQKLLRLWDEIKNGADFTQMAGKNSDCPSKSRGGDLGYFERGKMVKPFEAAAFQLKVGEVSEIVETPFGYHLVKLTDRQDPKVIPIESARDKIITLINNQKKSQAISDYLLKLHSVAKVDYSQGSQP